MCLVLCSVNSVVTLAQCSTIASNDNGAAAGLCDPTKHKPMGLLCIFMYICIYCSSMIVLRFGKNEAHRFRLRLRYIGFDGSGSVYSITTTHACAQATRVPHLHSPNTHTHTNKQKESPTTLPFSATAANACQPIQSLSWPKHEIWLRFHSIIFRFNSSNRPSTENEGLVLLRLTEATTTTTLWL